jgi:hypothetical protein
MPLAVALRKTGLKHPLSPLWAFCLLPTLGEVINWTTEWRLHQAGADLRGNKELNDV